MGTEFFTKENFACFSCLGNANGSVKVLRGDMFVDFFFFFFFRILAVFQEREITFEMKFSSEFLTAIFLILSKNFVTRRLSTVYESDDRVKLCEKQRFKGLHEECI